VSYLEANTAPVFAARAPVASVEPREGNHYVLRFSDGQIAAAAQPGQFVTILKPDSLMMLRRPFTIYEVDGDAVAVLVKVVGMGTHVLSRSQPGDPLDVMGPLGHGFRLDRSADPVVLVGGGTGVAVLEFAARRLVAMGRTVAAFAGLERDVPLDMTARDSGEKELSALAELGACSRVATMQPREGCHTGFVTDLVERWLAEHPGPAEIMACGPKPMLHRAAEIAAGAGLPCQVSMEERMGCGIGACSGCVCQVRVKGEPAYKRVCVDGPVFDAEDVVW